ncbi:lysophospholipid acyltransferase family protein [Hahella ganghwensis]|uniref:lysophospholipid acyltransferase family protein n=1 Tax=Hahella ganghwensis TaxID=286420 RepID=UPI0003623E68|nr:lysophospholipid acyltransferase family protein [Hahella ganghwensis]
MQIINALRSTIFYIGYAFGVILVGCMSICLGAFVDFEKRYYLISRFNVFAIWWAKVICGLKYEIEGIENIPEQACVVVSNHQSAWETYLLGIMFRPQATVLKQELIKIPFFGWALKKVMPIALDRSKPALALKQLLKQGKERLAAGLWVVIYPEGTRIRKGGYGRYNKGATYLACAAGVPLLPIAHNAGTCWPLDSMLKVPGKIKVVIGKPIPTEGRSRDEVHSEMEQWIRTNVRAIPGGEAWPESQT